MSQLSTISDSSRYSVSAYSYQIVAVRPFAQSKVRSNIIKFYSENVDCSAARNRRFFRTLLK